MRTSMKLRTYDKVPQWARFFSLEELHAFLRTVEEELHRRRLLFEGREGVVIVATPDGQVHQCGLANLALRCAAVGRAGFEKAVAEHFEPLFGQLGPIAEPAPTFESVRPHMKIRIYEDAFLAEKTEKVVARRLSVDINATVVYDFPHLVLAMPVSDLQRWKITEEEAFRIGRANLAKTKTERMPIKLACGAPCFCLFGEEGYGSAHIVGLATFLDRPSMLGAIVSFPARNALLCSPIQRVTILPALRELIVLANAMYRDSAEEEKSPLSPNLYWWKSGKLTHLPSGINILGLHGCVFAPPPEFIEEVLEKAGGSFTGAPTILN